MQWCGYIQGAFLRRRGKQKQGSWGHCLEIAYQPQPCQHQVTLASRHTDGDFSSGGSMSPNKQLVSFIFIASNIELVQNVCQNYTIWP